MNDSTLGLDGRRVRLRGLYQSDYDYLFALSNAPELAFRWRHRPGTLNPAQFSDVLWRGVWLQFLVEQRETSRPVGLAVAYNPDFQNRFAYIAYVADPTVHRVGWHLEATDIFIDHLFGAYDLRKLYGETTQSAIRSFARGAANALHEEGRLRAHSYLNGHYEDLIVLAIYRNEWLERRENDRAIRLSRREMVSESG